MQLRIGDLHHLVGSQHSTGRLDHEVLGLLGVRHEHLGANGFLWYGLRHHVWNKVALGNGREDEVLQRRKWDEAEKSSAAEAQVPSQAVRQTIVCLSELVPGAYSLNFRHASSLKKFRLSLFSFRFLKSTSNYIINFLYSDSLYSSFL